MSATTTDLVITLKGGQTRGYPVGAEEVLYGGSLCCVDADGYAVDGEDAINLAFGGLVLAQADNSSGAAGALQVEVRVAGEARLAHSGLTAADVGATVYLVDNATVGPAGGRTGHIAVGVMVEYVDADTCWVRLGQSKGPRSVVTVKAAGTNAAALDLTDAAELLGGSDLYVHGVLAAQSYTTADGTLSDGLLVVTTDYTLSGGVVTVVGDQRSKTWLLTLIYSLEA